MARNSATILSCRLSSSLMNWLVTRKRRRRNELVSARIEPVSVGTERRISDIGKSRPETGAGRQPKSCQIPASQRLRDHPPMKFPAHADAVKLAAEIEAE